MLFGAQCAGIGCKLQHTFFLNDAHRFLKSSETQHRAPSSPVSVPKWVYSST